MAQIAEEFVNIDDRLRLVLFGLECAFGVEFDPRETERGFQDAKEGLRSDKEYIFYQLPPLRLFFYQSPHLRVFGRVDDYEPEHIRLFVEGRRKFV